MAEAGGISARQRRRFRNDGMVAVSKQRPGGACYDKHRYAESALTQGLKLAPTDYAGLVIMVKCKLSREKYDQALVYSEKAKQAYPQEAQANHLSGFSKIKLKKL